MKKGDLKTIVIIGLLIGVLIQPVLVNVLNGISLVQRIAIFIGLAVLAPTVLYVAYLIGKVVPVLYQFAKFAAVGTLNTMVDFGVLNLEIFLSNIYQGVGYSVFKAISFICATTNSFFWNKYWTFGAAGKATAGEAVRFYVIAGVGWILNVSAASLVVNILARPAVISPGQWSNIGALAGVAAAFLWDFLGYKFIVFKKTSVAAEPVNPNH